MQNTVNDESNAVCSEHEWEDTEIYRDIKTALLKRLSKNGTTDVYHTDLVDTYMACWCDTKRLEDDIKARGVTVSWSNGGGQMGHKRNESVGEKNKVITQMLKILEALNIRPDDGPLEGGSNAL